MSAKMIRNECNNDDDDDNNNTQNNKIQMQW